MEEVKFELSVEKRSKSTTAGVDGGQAENKARCRNGRAFL